MAGMMGGGFSPLELSPALWLDALDASTVTLVSSAVSQWADKSGNNRHAVQATSGSRPTYSSSQIVFNGSKNLTSPLSGFTAGAGASWFVSFTLDDVSANTGIMGTSGNDDYDRFIGNGYQYPARFRSVRIENYRVFPTSGNHVLSGITSTSTGWEEWVDGTTGGNQTVSFAAPTDLTVGSIRAATNGSGSAAKFLNGKIGEILIFPSALSTTNRQKVEGYMAWRAGTQSLLPSGHPYKTVAP